MAGYEKSPNVLRRAAWWYLLACIWLVMASCGGDSTPTTSAVGIPSLGGSAAELFADPEGAYEISIHPDWEADHGSIAPGVEVWAIAEEATGFTPNVNIITQVTPPGMTVTEFVELSIEGADDSFAQFELIDQEIIDIPGDGQLGVMEYTGSPTGQPLQFLGVFAMRRNQAVVATLTALPEDFGSLREEVEPYLLSLRPAP